MLHWIFICKIKKHEKWFRTLTARAACRGKFDGQAAM